FFFSSRRRHTRCLSDWSSDVCSSDLGADDILVGIVGRLTEVKNHELFLQAAALYKNQFSDQSSNKSVRFVVIGDGELRNTLEQRSEERRVGKECRYRWWMYD